MGKWLKYPKKYQKDWENEKEFKGWLHSVPHNTTEARCTCCNVVLRAHKTDLVRHANSLKHKSFSKILTSSTSISSYVKPVSNESKRIDLKLSYHTACHSSVRTIDHLSTLVKDCAKDSNSKLKDLSLHRTKCCAIINKVIAPAMLKDLVADINNGFYSLILDESTDISTVKYLCIMIRYFSESKCNIVTNFLTLVEVTHATADNLFKQLKETLKSVKLPMKHCLGLGTDGGSNLCGVNHSLFTLMKNEIPHLILIKCVCHSSHLCCSKAFKEMPSHLEFMLRETYNWFKNSPLRRSVYSNIYNLINTGEDKYQHKLVSLSGTRWLALGNAVNIILKQWLELQTHFDVSSNAEKCYTAKLLKEMYNDPQNKLFFLFLKPLLQQFQEANLLFQQEYDDHYCLYQDLESFIMCLLKRFIKVDILTQNGINVNLNDTNNFLPLASIDYGIEFKHAVSNSHLPENAIVGIMLRCKSFLITAAIECQTRLPANLSIFQKFKNFNPQSCLSHVNGPAFSELPLDLAVSLGFDLSVLENQWRQLLVTNWTSVFNGCIPKTALEFWPKVMTLKNAIGAPIMKEIALFVLSLLCLPISNATVERAFSVMTCVKTKLKNRMNLTSLESIMRIKIHNSVMKKCCNEFIPSETMLSLFDSSIYAKYNENQEEDVENEVCMSDVVQIIDEIGI